MTTAPEAPDAAPSATEEGGRRARKHRFLGPVGRLLGRIPHPPWNSRRGLLVLVFLIGGFGAAVAVGGVVTVHYTETAAFCGKCHTMDPELKAHAASAHKELTCAECHVEPGVKGWIKAKANGTKQLIEIVTGSYPKPIPPPDHSELPSVQSTCLKCHSEENITANGGPMKLVMRPRYQLDEANSREMVAVLVRPGGLTAGKGVHWHIQKDVSYTTTNGREQRIDLVQIKEGDGETETFIAGQQVNVSTDVQPDVDRLKATQTMTRMTCLGCHNRVGHQIPTPEQAVDAAIASGKIKASLPYVKRESVALLQRNYATLAAADAAIAGLRNTYAARYPLVLDKQATAVDAAVDELKEIYREVATPEMKVQAKTYADNLGHQSSPGCFRCHDGAHYKVVKGRITKATIPSTCGTCHTFPQIGATVADVPLGEKPASHSAKLFVFDHKNSVTSSNPTGTSCAACHQKSYCENCHKSGAVKVKHDTMLYNHSNAATAAGGTAACATCHQPAYCSNCHKDPVLTPKLVALPPGRTPDVQP
jgi:nitrate/TMAO reductase-like tetraheme cytochrome c subunit